MKKLFLASMIAVTSISFAGIPAEAKTVIKTDHGRYHQASQSTPLPYQGSQALEASPHGC
ncbi:hypothetical protein LB533_26590 [Mesorhizobium sp. BR1-1-13]|uniref:hypothetical protein n=1 Tax=Mesorhizobium sp. BR1-1-13 TaxID=2876656 RepID=UPI001CD13719|nr:hypothetical protein [Mesorhizobium sp. BR1-1-13]MBZ9944666.1 hypothetical protein [Mesorhizobium sp. BR1-1-13]